MEKREVIVDTCFLEKLSNEGKNVLNIQKTLNALDYTPVVHPYIAKHELKLKSYLQKLVDDKYIHIIDYNDFLANKSDKKLYESYFFQLHEDLRIYLDAINGPKHLDKLFIPGGKTIYNTHKQGNSMGDVHMILMATFMKLPIILTEDSDLGLLRKIVKRSINIGSYNLEIFNGVDLIKELAAKPESPLSRDELRQILINMGEKTHKAEINQIWDKYHTE